MKILITGDRNWTDTEYIWMVLDRERAIWASELEWDLIIHGGCRGADLIAADWAHSRGIHTAQVAALWDYHKRAAGPIRNSMMMYLQPDLVIAFHPDLSVSKGTADMVRKAQRKHTPVEIYNGRSRSEVSTQSET